MSCLKLWKKMVNDKCYYINCNNSFCSFKFFVINPQYEASTKVFIGKDESGDQSYSQNDVLIYQKLIKTYSEAIKTKDLISRGLKEGIDSKGDDLVCSSDSIIIRTLDNLYNKMKITSIMRDY